MFYSVKYDSQMTVKNSKDRGTKIMNLRKGSALRPEREVMCLFHEKAKTSNAIIFLPCFKSYISLILTTSFRKQYTPPSNKAIRLLEIRNPPLKSVNMSALFVYSRFKIILNNI